MTKTAAIFLTASIALISCKKEDVRGVTYKAECTHCWVSYEVSGEVSTVEVYGKWEKRLTMDSGDGARISVCGFNNPVGGTTGTLPPMNPSTVWVFLDNAIWSDASASTIGSRVDSVASNGAWRKFYADTCASASVVIPKR